MKTALKTIGLLCIATLFVACDQNKSPTPYKISGEFISMIPDVSEDVVETDEVTTDEPEGTDTESDALVEEVVDEPIDLSKVVLTISYDTVNSDGEAETVSLVDEPFNGTFEFEDETMEPTEVTISLKVSEDSEPMEINTVVGTGHDIHFKLIDHPGPDTDQLILVGTAIQTVASENKFTISGDLSEFDEEFNNDSLVRVWASTTGDDGESHTLDWGPVFVHENSFHIEGDITEPLLGTLSITKANGGPSASTQVVLEPKGEIVVSKLGNQSMELSTTSGEGYHAQLISSWQHKDEYIALVDAWVPEYELAMNPPESDDDAESGKDENVMEEAEDLEIADEESDTESEETTDKEQETTESVASVEPAEGCENAEVGKYAEPTPAMDDDSGLPYWFSLRMQSIEIRNATLRKVFDESEDPTAQHIAMKMRPYDFDEAAEELAAWKILSQKYDADYVAIHITPQIENLEKRVLLAENDELLVPGQKAPEFTLLDLDGDEVSLYKVLGENDMVLVDFWASWCGPCIADFPDLKKLYAAYNDDAFEIVGVSIDSTDEDWMGGVEDNSLPWIQLGELKGWYGPIGIQYGVGWIPKGYLIDSKGCIYEKDIRPDALKEFLVNRYGMDESLDEPELETEDSQGVSG